ANMKYADPRIAGLLAAAVALGGCVGAMAPMVAAAPGPGKTPPMFEADASVCRAYADQQITPYRNQANNNAVGTAVVTTALGAALGAAAGGGRGAAIGAASGAVVGTGIAANNAQFAGLQLQQQYDAFYMQCMYGRGNSTPGWAPGYYGMPPYAGPR